MKGRIKPLEYHQNSSLSGLINNFEKKRAAGVEEIRKKYRKNSFQNRRCSQFQTKLNFCIFKSGFVHQM